MFEWLATAAPVAGLHVLSVATPATPLRAEARSIVRAALQEALAALLPAEKGSISLLSAPGQPIRLAAPSAGIGLSVSHEAGCSVAAIKLNGPVGIDLLRLREALPDIALLSRDYLGPRAAAAIASLPEAGQQTAFARAWTTHEASLKCLGLPLTEWTPALAERLAACTGVGIVMPEGWIGAVAILKPGAY